MKETKVNKTKNPFNIKTPTTVEEFRNNLKKYYLCVGDELVMKNEKSVPIDEISSLSDLYDKVEGFDVWIVPQIILKKDIIDYMEENNLSWGVEGYFDDENNFEVFDDQSELIGKDGKWYKIDNQILRDFYYFSLGEFSGYKLNEEMN